MILDYKLFEMKQDKYLELKGKILFDPKDQTKKHKKQASWKKMALINLPGDLCDYYAWLIDKRYNLKLNLPLRGAHISFINDSVRDIKQGLKCSEEEALQKWEEIKQKWNNKEIKVWLDPDARSDGKYWWLNIPKEKRKTIHQIRNELGLGQPFWSLHMSIGYANEKNISHSKYIVRLASQDPDYN
jgi:hypothetical protein